MFVLPTEDREVVRAVGRRSIAAYLNVPVYPAFHEWLGRGEVLQPMRDAWRAGDRAAATVAIPDDVVDQLIVHGSALWTAATISLVMPRRRLPPRRP